MSSALDKIEKRFADITIQMADPAVAGDRVSFEKLARELAKIKPLVTTYQQYKKIKSAITQAHEVIEEGDDSELMELAREEIATLQPQLDNLDSAISLLLVPKDPYAGKNVILEIRAGTGGDEAGLFAADLFRMYSRFAERRKWKVEALSLNETGKGGFKEIIASVSGKDVYSTLKYESGTHRVQRVPETEASGRIHTSACTVAVLPEAEEVDVEIDPGDLRIDVFRSSGHGGQSVNTTDSAVRLTHLPTGIVISMQDEKSQHKNKTKAMKVLASRLLDLRSREEAAKRALERKSQVGTGDRSERIRTYNFPQGRVSDHRVNLTLYKLESVMDGELDEFAQALAEAERQDAIRNAGAGMDA